MKKTEKPFRIPLIFIIIPAIIFLIFLSIFLFSEIKENPAAEVVWFFATAFLSLFSIVSLILIFKLHIKFFRPFVRTLLTDVLLLIGGVIFGLWFEKIIMVFIVIYPIVCILMIANRVKLTLDKHRTSYADYPELSHIILITLINPLLPLLPTLMAFAYALAHFEISL